MAIASKDSVKNLIGQIPYAAELYWLVRQNGKPIQSRFSLKRLQETMPDLVADVQTLRTANATTNVEGKKVFLFATMHFWIEHAALMGLALSAMGNNVNLGFLPYGDWRASINKFDLKRQNYYAKKVLSLASGVMEQTALLTIKPSYKPLPSEIMNAVKQVTQYDTQYTLQVEDVDEQSDIYRLRYERNLEAARAAYLWLQNGRPDVLIVPNGTIQELGIVYRVARHLKINTVTYEFGDQRQRIWFALNKEVMRQETDALWEARRERDLQQTQLERVKALFAARQHATTWENFARRWQGIPSQGGAQARAALGLDDRPVVLLATNVLGDSLTLGRQVFSHSMSEWVSRTVQYFAGRDDAQLIIRVHPGELLTHGLSMVDVVKQVLPKLPKHIHLISASEKINTYDLIEVADVGLVYTTTVGLEMAMSGLPVIVAGHTHFRNRGFTHDAESWVTYFKLLGQILENPQKYRLKSEEAELAWQYAYRFFFEYSRPYPWHLVRMWDDYKARPLKTVFTPEYMEQYGETFKHLVGEPIDWKNITEG
jgi:hypothetical protein